MKKNALGVGFPASGQFIKCLIMMKFTILLVLAFSLQSFARGYGQEAISLNLEKVTLKKVFKAIEQQGACRFVYRDEILPRDQRVSIAVENASLDEVLRRVLQNTDLSYKKLTGSLVVITPENTAAAVQAFTVTGKIVNDRSEPLQGVNVVEKGTTNGTTTNADGQFVINVTNADATLLISYIGYVTQEIPVNKQTVVNGTLVAENKSIEEVVVVGYGTQKKKLVTGAISSVRSADLENMPVFRVEQSLQGRTSGLTITSASGQPGEGSTVRVRGTSSIDANSDPLYVVDGVVVGGGIDYLSQSDIETIDVLKDAASAAIYGTQASNGVILITTKKGRQGAVKVNYNGFVGTQAPWRRLKLLNSQEYATIMNEAHAAANKALPYANPASLGKGTDWQDAVFNNNAMIQNHELNISGGSERSTYFGSFGYLNQDGIVATSNSNYKRFTVRFNSQHKIGKAITFGNNIGYTRTKSQGVGTNGEWGTPLNRAINLDPLTPVVETDPNIIGQSPYNNPLVVRDENGNPYGISSRVTSEILNPIAALKVGQGNGWSDKIVANVFAEVEPIKGLKFRSSIGTDLAFWGDESFQPLYYLNSINLNDSLNGYTRNSNRGMYWIWDNTISYTRSFGVHNLSALVGTSAQRNYGESQGGTKRGIPVDNLKDASLNYQVPQTSQFFWGGEYQSRLASIFGRINYDYDGKYLFNAIVRRDGSSRFGSNNKFGIFPSVSLGWVASRESFWPENDKITFLKVRGSYGENGNDRIGDNRFVSTVGGGRNYTINGVLIQGFSPNAIANPDLRWEKTSQLDIGIDAVLFRRLNVTIDWYNKKTTDMLLQIDVPGYVGNVGPIGNIADMENRGIELELGYSGRVGELNFNVSGNVSHLRNRVTYLGDDKEFLGGQTFGPQGVPITRTYVGYAIGSFYGFKTDGLFQNWADVNGHVNKDGDKLQPAAAPGDLRYVDVNDDGLIDNNDRTIIGDPTPDWSFGFTASAEYKGFDLTVFGQGVAGNQVFQAIRRFDLQGANYTTEALGRWTGEGSSNYFPRLHLDDPNKNFSQSSDFFLKKGDYFRIKTLQIGYSFPNRIVSKAGLNKLRVYVMSNNLLTLTKYSGFDPEIGGGSYGTDRGIYPQARSFMAGINIGF